MEHSEEEMGAPPPGFRFFPTEEELISFYLHNKLLTAGAAANANNNLSRIMDHIIPVLDIYQFNPWDLPQHSGVVSQDEAEQWFFFIPRQENEARGGRPNRLTTVGYWKATGSPGFVFCSGNRAIGVKRTMVFYIGRAPNGTKTVWKMNEYKALVASVVSTPRTPPIHPALMRQEFSLCRVYQKSKCLRAFDRRPCAPVRDDHLQGTSQQQPPHQILDQPIMIINPTNLLDEINDSSSRDLTINHGIANLPHRHNQAAEEESNIMEMDAEDCENQGALWDYCFHGF